MASSELLDDEFISFFGFAAASNNNVPQADKRIPVVPLKSESTALLCACLSFSTPLRFLPLWLTECFCVYFLCLCHS